MKNSQILNFIKIRPVAAELFYADGQKNTQLTVFFLFAILRTRLKPKYRPLYLWGAVLLGVGLGLQARGMPCFQKFIK